MEPHTASYPVLAGAISAGGLGFLIVVLLILAASGIFFAMSRSLRRMRQNVSNGEFRGIAPRGADDGEKAAGPVEPAADPKP